MKKILLIVIVPSILLALVLLGQIDDTLSPEAVELIGQFKEPQESQAYLYLLGIYASKNDDPVEVGKRLFEEYKKQESDDSYELVEYEQSKKISLPSGDLFCKVWEEGCLARLFDSEFDEKLQATHGLLISRVNAFYDFDEYTTLTKPSIMEPYPHYRYLSAAERLKVLNAIGVYKAGAPEEAILALQNQFKRLRRVLELQDNLVGKLVTLSSLAEIIDVKSAILSAASLQTDRLENLTLSEKDLSAAFARELALLYKAFKDVDKHPQFFSTQRKVPSWLTRLVYKLNMTINAVAPRYTRFIHLSKLTPAEFARQVKEEPKQTASVSKLRNYIGFALAETSPEFHFYVAQFKDFEAKVELFNHRYHLQRDLAEASNPYYDNEKPEILEDKACFRGPFEDIKFLRCLRTAL